MSFSDVYDELWGAEEASPSPFNANELARYFRDALQKADWHSGFATVNVLALASQIKRWSKTHEPDTVKTVIDAYMSDGQWRGKNPGWRDFLVQADRIATSLLKPEQKKQEDKWDLLEKELEAKYAGSND